jgi:type II secretory pathway predicted ATPase ExeA
VLLIDEAQLVSADCLTELRILQSDHFDSQSLLFTILCGDGRLPERFRSAELLPLGSRIGPRLPLSAPGYPYRTCRTSYSNNIWSSPWIRPVARI